MRKNMIFFLTVLLLLCNAGCSLLNTTSESGLPLQVGLLTDGGSVENGGMNQLVWTHFQKLKNEIPGFEAHYKVPGQDGGYSECAAVLAERGCMLIVCVDGTMADTIETVAGENPNCKFLVLDCEAVNASNAISVQFSLHEAVYLAGYAAAKTSISERVGCIHSRMTEDTEHLVVSFMAGARAANNDITILRRNVMTQRDQGRLAAEEMVANGVDVIFHADGNADSPVIRVCEENGIWAVDANDEPGYEKPDCVLALAEKLVDSALRQLIDEMIAGELKTGSRVFDFSNDGVLLTTKEDIIPEKTLTSIKNVQEKLAAGELSIPTTFEELYEKYPDLAENQ